MTHPAIVDPNADKLKAASAMLAALVDAELLARVNAPVTDGSPMHKAIVKAIAAAKAAGIKSES